MLCDRCKKSEAIVRYTQIIHDEKKVINLCKFCALEKELDNPLLDILKIFGKLIVEIISKYLEKQGAETDKRSKNLICKKCGLSWDDFQSTGRLGCGECYQSFLDNMKFILRRLHGCNRHVGRKPGGRSEEDEKSLDSLEKQLKAAIKAEKYELAAELRDSIREKKRKQKIEYHHESDN